MENKEKTTPENETSVNDSNEEKTEKKNISFLSALSNFGNRLYKTFLSPSVLTVIITAVVAPIAINWVNESIENKKLQMEVISTVLDYTSQTDFSKPESLEKITIIAKMVDENKSIFGLSFSQTDSTIQSLYGQISKVGIANLNRKQKEYQQKIDDINQKLANDTTAINMYQKEIARLRQDYESALKNQRTERAKELENKIAEKEVALKDLNNSRDVYLNQIRYWKEQKRLLAEDIETAKQDLTEILVKSRRKEAEYKEILEEKNVNVDSLKRKLTNALEQIRNLNKYANDLDTINSTLQERVKQYENKAKRLEHELNNCRGRGDVR